MGWSTTHQKRKKLLSDGDHLGLLLRCVYRLTVFVLMVLTANLVLATQCIGNMATLPSARLRQNEICIGSGKIEGCVLMLPAAQQGGANSVCHGVPLATAGHPEIGAKACPEADQRTQQAKEQAMGVNQGEYGVFHWVMFWGLCSFMGFCFGRIASGR